MDIYSWINATVIITAFSAASYYYGKIILDMVPQGYEKIMAYTYGFYFLIAYMLLPMFFVYVLIRGFLYSLEINIYILAFLALVFELIKLGISAKIGRRAGYIRMRKIVEGFDPNKYSLNPREKEKQRLTLEEMGYNGLKAFGLWFLSFIYVPGLSYLLTFPQNLSAVTIFWIFLDIVVMIVGLGRFASYIGVMFAGFFDVDIHLANGKVIKGRLIKYGDPTIVWKIEGKNIKKYTIPKYNIVYGESMETIKR